MELKDTGAVIIGSTGGLGSAVALALAEAGCNCICHYHHNEKFAGELVEQIRKLGRKAVAVRADISRADEIPKLFEAAEVGNVRILINAAGVFFRQALEEITFEDAQKMLNVNLIGPVLVSQQFVRDVNENFGGAGRDGPVAKIVNLVDIAAIRPWAGYALYCASKAGLIAATRSMAKELAPAICVNAVAPGIVTWPGDMDEGEKSRQLSQIPAARIGWAGDVVSAIMFLLKSDYITGEVITVDGGRSV